MAAHTQDDGFHEIQLNGKQLVFLFMAATVVSVVIFLSGVLVGRGVRTERANMAQSAAINDAPAPDALPTPKPLAAQVQPGADPTIAPPPPTVDDPSENIRPDRKRADPPAAAPAAPPAGTSGGPAPAVARASNDAPRAKAPEPAPPAPTAMAKPSAPAADVKPALPSPPPAAAAATPPADADGYTVQVAALNVRSEADAIAKRLSAKGYAAYVQVPPNTTSVFRVRVGSFKTRHEAETLAAKLQKEEQIKPWVTR